jgi:hypothetical protein
MAAPHVHIIHGRAVQSSPTRRLIAAPHVHVIHTIVRDRRVEIAAAPARRR